MQKPKHVFFKFLRYCYRAHKPFFYVATASILIQTIIVIFNSFSLSIILSYGEKREWNSFYLILGGVVLTNIILLFLSRYFNKLQVIHKDKAVKKINQIAATHMVEVPFSYLENSEYLELKERVKFAIENQGIIESFIYSLFQLVQNLVTLLGLTTLLLFFDYFLVLVIVIALTLQIVITLLILKIQMKFYHDLIPINRKYDYYFTQLFDSKNAKDFRMYAIGKTMNNNFSTYCDKVASYFSNVQKKITVASVFSVVIKGVELAVIYLLVLMNTVKNKLSIALFSLNVSAATSLSQTLFSMIRMMIEFTRNYAYIVPYIELMELPREVDNGTTTLDGELTTIEFKNVSFKYPGTDSLVLKNISFRVNKGEKISIVGLNGAGKTTLIKLLCRLYQPTEGEILVNDLPISRYEYHSYLKNISAVFQDYKLFAYSLRDNITINPDTSNEVYEEVYKVGLKDLITKLPKKLDSMYGKEFSEDGIELSGGEAQKIAIARALYRDSDLIVLDEPTSALDPLAEAEIYENFNSLVGNKMAFYISHRMSSSIFCDKILVIDDGKITGFAPHKELMKQKESLYYKLFTLQKENYRI